MSLLKVITTPPKLSTEVIEALRLMLYFGLPGHLDLIVRLKVYIVNKGLGFKSLRASPKV
jgi:hypothetical protein